MLSSLRPIFFKEKHFVREILITMHFNNVLDVGHISLSRFCQLHYIYFIVIRAIIQFFELHVLHQ